MFCKWCGNKIENNGAPCPTCGKTQDALENGNGFWDLCEFEPEGKQETVSAPAMEDARPKEHQPTESTPAAEQQPKRAAQNQNQNTPILMYAVLLLLLAVLIESTISLVQTSNGINRILSLQSQINTSRSAASADSSKITVDYDFAAISSFQPDASEASEQTESEAATESEAVSDDFEELLNTSSIVMDQIIESFEIDSKYSNQLLIVTGDAAEKNSAAIIWQGYDEQAKAWTMIAEGQRYMMPDKKDGIKQIRALCFTSDELMQREIHGAECRLNAAKKQAR